MARQNSTLTARGKVGNLVGMKGRRGQTLARLYVADPTNPQTQAQIVVRSRFKLASNVATMLGQVGKIACVANGKKQTDRGYLQGLIMSLINQNNTSSTSTSQLLGDLPLVKAPTVETLYDGIRFTAEMVQSTGGESVIQCRLAVTFGSGNPTSAFGAIALMVYNSTKDQWRFASILRTNVSFVTVFLPGDWRNDTMTYFGYVLPAYTGTEDSLVGTGIIGDTSTNHNDFQLISQLVSSRSNSIFYSQIRSERGTVTISQ